jgi:hypothetical protein
MGGLEIETVVTSETMVFAPIMSNLTPKVKRGKNKGATGGTVSHFSGLKHAVLPPGFKL